MQIRSKPEVSSNTAVAAHRRFAIDAIAAGSSPGAANYQETSIMTAISSNSHDGSSVCVEMAF